MTQFKVPFRYWAPGTENQTEKRVDNDMATWISPGFIWILGLECRVKVLGFRLGVQVWVSGFWEAWGSSGYLQGLNFSARVWVQCLGFGFGV